MNEYRFESLGRSRVAFQKARGAFRMVTFSVSLIVSSVVLTHCARMFHPALQATQKKSIKPFLDLTHFQSVVEF